MTSIHPPPTSVTTTSTTTYGTIPVNNINDVDDDHNYVPLHHDDFDDETKALLSLTNGGGGGGGTGTSTAATTVTCSSRGSTKWYNHTITVLLSSLSLSFYKKWIQTYWSLLTFQWFTPILYRGNEKQMLDSIDLELVPLPDDCQTGTIMNQFEYYWNTIELQQQPQGQEQQQQQEKQFNNKNNNKNNKNNKKYHHGQQQQQPSIVRALFRSFGIDYIRAGILKCIHDGCLFVGPQILRRMIVYLRTSIPTNNNDNSSTSSNEFTTSIYYGFVLVLIVTISQLIMSLCLRHYFYKCYITGLRIRTAIVTSIYHKAFTLSNEQRQLYSIGEIINFMSIDSQRLQDLTTYLHSLWSSPFQIIIALYFLWNELGISSLGGVIVIIIMIPVTKTVSSWMSKQQKQLMYVKDKRIELNNEILSNMKIIKLQGQEEPYEQRLLQLRTNELKQLFIYYIGSACSRTLWTVTPLLVAIATFTVYVATGHQLDVATALTSIALFDILRFPLFMLPTVINGVVEAYISLKRVQTFLLCTDYHPLSEGNLVENGTIVLNNVSVTYGNPTTKKKNNNNNTKNNVTVPVITPSSTSNNKTNDTKQQPLFITEEEEEQMKFEMALLQEQLMEAENEIGRLKQQQQQQSKLKLTTSEDNDSISTNPNNNNTNQSSSSSSSLLCLRRITLECHPGDFIVIVGSVGSGKTTLIQTLLGELTIVSGGSTTTISTTSSAYRKGSVAYFSQTPFIMNATVRDNIVLFGQATTETETAHATTLVEEDNTNNTTSSTIVDEEWYQQCIDCCALRHDLQLLPYKDQTEIGEKGITLSGGQKARIALARCVYYNATITIVDDALSAVDAHVAKHILEQALFQQLLTDRTITTNNNTKTKKNKRSVVLVTNAVQYLNDTRITKIYVLEHGKIVECGTYNELIQNPLSTFSRYVSVTNATTSSSTSSSSMQQPQQPPQGLSVPVASTTTTTATTTATTNTTIGMDGVKNGDTTATATPTPTTTTTNRGGVDDDDDDVKNVKLAKISNKQQQQQPPQSLSTLMTDEIRETGHVRWDVYYAWAQASGGIIVPIVFVLVFIFVESITILSNWWLTYWSAHGNDSNANQYYFLAIYASIGCIIAIAGLFRMILVSYYGIKASSKLYVNMLHVVLYAKMSFFDTTPIGRLMNRFSKDIYTTDEKVTETMRTYLGTLFAVFSTIAVISFVTPIFTICLLPMIWFYIHEQQFFTLTYRELKRIDSTTRSPLYALLGETIDGAMIIRAFGTNAQTILYQRFINILNTQQHAYFLTCVAQSWLAIRLELIGTLIVSFTCTSAIVQHYYYYYFLVQYDDNDDDDPNTKYNTFQHFAGLAGLAISYSLSVTQSLNYSVRMASDMEANMVSVERIYEYTKSIENEGQRITPMDSILTKQQWPTHGTIVFTNVQLRYRPELPLVLKGLTITITGGSKVGVVGRTGAGKSTLMVCLLRIVEMENDCNGNSNSSSITIDDVDIRTIGLAKLRSSIAVIPQDPILFSGTVRTNLDPFNEHCDERLIESLQQVGLYSNSNSNNNNNNNTNSETNNQSIPTTTTSNNNTNNNNNNNNNASSSSTTSSSTTTTLARIDSLDNIVVEGGTNFSIGQRQLLVIARALLRQTKIVIMDEATASIDNETDNMIQTVFRTVLKHSTVITIAHRINTIMDSDCIIVMDNGVAVEYDTPTTLLNKKNSMFKDLVHAAATTTTSTTH